MSVEAIEIVMAKPAVKPNWLGLLLEFARFLATGAIAAISNMLAVWAFEFVMPLLAAAILGYIVGMVIAFILFQQVIFDHPGTSLKRRIFRFTVVNMVGLCLSVATTMVLATYVLPGLHWQWLEHSGLTNRVANFFGVCVPAFSSYFGHKYYTYR